MPELTKIYPDLRGELKLILILYHVTQLHLRVNLPSMKAHVLKCLKIAVPAGKHSIIPISSYAAWSSGIVPAFWYCKNVGM